MSYIDLRRLLPPNSREIMFGFPGGDILINVQTLEIREIGQAMPPLDDLAPLVQQFLEYLRIDRGYKPTTLKNYRTRLGQFLAWLSDIKLDPAKPTTWEIYYGTLVSRPLSPYTRKGHLEILRIFAAWLIRQGRLRVLPLQDTRPPKLPKGNTLRKAIFEEHTQAMLLAARQSKRDWSLFLFFRDTGCRTMEAIGLRWRDLYLKQGEPGRALVLGKGDKNRYLFWGIETSKALIAYRRTVPHNGSDRVWWGQMRYMNKLQAGPLTYWGIYKIFKTVAKRAGLKGDVFSPHAWRHAFGRDTSNNGIPTTQLQDLMGHSSIEVTKIYSQFNTKELQKAHSLYSPVDQDIAKLREAGLLPEEEPEEEGENGHPAGAQTAVGDPADSPPENGTQDSAQIGPLDTP